MAETGRSKPSEQRELQASLRAMQIDDCKLWMQTLAKRRRPEGLKCRAHEVRSRRPRSSWSPEDTEQSEVRRGGTQPRRRRGLCEDTEHRASEAQGGAKRKNAFPSRSLAVGGRKAAGGARTRPKGVRSAGTPRRRRRGRCAAPEHWAAVGGAHEGRALCAKQAVEALKGWRGEDSAKRSAVPEYRASEAQADTKTPMKQGVPQASL